MKKILVLGGGIAGIEAAIHLRKHKYDVTVVSNRDYLYVYPISIWIPTKDTKFEDVCVPNTELEKAHGFKIVKDEVVQIVQKEKKVICKNNTFTDYDFLVIAVGAGKVKHNGFNENALSICGVPEQSVEIADRLDELVKKGSGKIAMGFSGNPLDKSGVRGGPAFEVIFNVHNFLKKKGIRDNFELNFVATMPQPGKRLGPRALEMLDNYFNRLSINKYFGKKVKVFEKDQIIFEDDSVLETDLTMFIPANSGHQFIIDSDLPLNPAGFINISDSCLVDGTEDTYAIGDAAALKGPEWSAKQGHLAEVMARNVAFNIHNQIEGKPERKGYQDHINIVCVMDSGDGAAYVSRNRKGGKMLPMPIFGHWMKKMWGWYFKKSKLKKIPRFPGM